MARPALTARSQRLRIALAIPALLAIFVLGELLLDRRGWRLDLSPEQRYTLSDRAARVLDALPSDVRIVAFLRQQDPRNPVIEDMLQQATRRAPRLTVQIVDVNRSPALARQYGVDSYGALVVESEGRRRQLATPSEGALVAAILQVTRQQRRTVGWLVGHGEGDLDSADRHRGFSTVRRVLEQDFFDVRPVSLLGGDVPPETSVLVIAGPQKDLLPEELAVLDRYLQRPGDVLVLVDPFTVPRLAEFLRRYGLELVDDIVIDPARRLYGGEFVTMDIPIDREAHPILAPIEASALFSRSRSIRVAAAEAGTGAAVPFLFTSPESWATFDAGALQAGAPRFVPGRDRRGPVAVGAEVAFRAVASPGATPRQGRIVAYGNVEFANNFFIEFLGNKDLFVNSVAWLAHDPEAIAHRPYQQEPGIEQFFVSAEDVDRAFWATAVAVPAGLGLVGIVLGWRRRRG